jgi:hypothetical protein
LRGRRAGSFMPPFPFASEFGEHSGREGEDWKWRRAGRFVAGVDGINNRIGLVSLPGV